MTAASTDELIRSGEIDPMKEREMPPTDVRTGRTYYGLPDAYPDNREGFIEGQAESARWVIYQGISEGSEWHLRDGTKLEMWPGGDVFNEHGTLVGRFRLVSK